MVLGFLFVCHTWVNIYAHFYSEGFIVLVEMFLMIDEHFELILECVNEIFCLIELLLSVPGVLPERRGFEDGYDFYDKKSFTFFLFLLWWHDLYKRVYFINLLISFINN